MNAKTLLLVAPAIIIPLAGFISWSLSRGHRPGFSHLPPGARGFNMILPKALLPDSKNRDKLDAYKQAEQDSARYQSAITLVPNADSDANEQKVYRNIARLQEVLRAPKLPRQLTPDTRSTTVAPALISMQEAPEPPPISAAPDPEITQLSGVLDKILYIQHPEAFKPEPSKADPAETAAVDSGQTIEAVIISDQTLVSGESVPLRLLTDVRTKRGILPKNVELVGLASLDGERLHIHVKNILYKNAFYPLALEAYDLDGQSGIYIPGSLTRDVAHQSADEALGAISVGMMDPSVGAQATNAGIQAIKTLLSKKVKQVRVTVRANYHLILR